MSIHHGVSCDSCRKINFSGRRYKCLICNDFDLCPICFDKKINLSIQTHSIHHPMQLILTSNDYEYIYFGHIRTRRSPMSLTCSVCNQNGFPLDVLIKHVSEEHLTAISSILCPICFIRQNRLVEHLYQHTDENITIKTLNSNEKELKPLKKSNEQSLLEKLINNEQNKNTNETRYVFIHCLLTDLFR